MRVTVSWRKVQCSDVCLPCECGLCNFGMFAMWWDVFTCRFPFFTLNIDVSSQPGILISGPPIKTGFRIHGTNHSATWLVCVGSTVSSCTSDITEPVNPMLWLPTSTPTMHTTNQRSTTFHHHLSALALSLPALPSSTVLHGPPSALDDKLVCVQHHRPTSVHP